MSIEKWDVYNSDGKKSGKTITRGKGFLQTGQYHLVVHVWIVSSAGNFLIQRRAETKKPMPGEWAATGGSAVAGETSFSAARRELFEEIGIESDETTLKKLVRIKRRNSFIDVWLINTDVNIFDLKLQKSEVAEVRWVNRAELEKMITEGKYHNYGKEYFSSVFEKIEEKRGATV